MSEEKVACFHDMIREHVLLPVDPEVVESFLGAVKDLWEVGSLRVELLEHLPVEDLVRVCEVITVRSRVKDDSKGVHESFDTAQIGLANFSSLFVI